MLQAVAVEYAFDLYRSSENAFAHSFAMYLYDWAMLEGGLSVSMYILANLCLGCWVILHSFGLYQANTSKLLFVFGSFVWGLMIIGHIASWFF